MYIELQSAIDEYIRRRSGDPALRCEVRSADPWQLDVGFSLVDGEAYRIRSLRPGDEAALHEFADQLGPRSKWLFCPFPWGDSQELEAAFGRAIQRTVSRARASYLLFHRARSIGHFYLTGLRETSVVEPLEPRVPELGIGIADAYHGRSLGGLAVRLLQAVGRDLAVDAIELTTHPENIAGYRTYLGAGFEQVGMLCIAAPAGMDGPDAAQPHRDERHMVYIINSAKCRAVLEQLALERAAALR
jgi:RimJ/RimL family protein N-acetyltransferase